ncbi:hypothetical protein A9Q81_13005 [Gammaproteobacteria bacterium 42_54_T18]|nr:hypothetical protein A9Q81_13005 [Gammaproteobacteria bacterium 42_54_T18]
MSLHQMDLPVNASFGHAPIQLPLQMRLLNALGPCFAAMGFFNMKEDPDHYMRWAQQKLDLDSFGEFDLRTPLKYLLNTLKHEAGLGLFGRIAADKMIRRNLMNNLLLQEEFVKNPTLGDVDVESPLIIICTPRTGSTLLHNLLAQHTESRALKMWELHRPNPAPLPINEFTDQRIKQSDQEFGMYYRMVPDMKAIHYFAPEAIEECTHIFNNLFSCRLSFSTMANTSSYTDWIMEQDMTDTYIAYKKHLQVLKYHYQKKILVLKSPAHILSLDALTNVFPKAKIIHLHRDPATAAGSFCSLTEAVQISMRNQVDTQAIGGMWRKIWTPAMLNSVAWRKNKQLDVLDVNFKTLIRDPCRTVENIYQHFNLPVPNSLKGSVHRYLQEHPKDEYGTHQYSLERYGLCRRELHREYRDYIDYYQVPLEADS